MLGYFNQMNALFQSKGSLISIIQKESIRMTRLICRNFIKPQILDFSKIDPDNENQLLPLDQVGLGRECEAILSSLDDDESNQHFKNRCLSFYQTALILLSSRKDCVFFTPCFTK